MTQPSFWQILTLDEWLKIISLFGTFVAWFFASRRNPRLEAFFTHGAAHPVPGTGNPVHTHALLVRNSGSAAALNVRIGHTFVPPNTDIQIHPDTIQRTVTKVGLHGSEIHIERLRPKEQVVLSYLYPGPTLYSQFGTVVKFDDGFAHFFPIQHVPVLPKTVYMLVAYLMAAGFCLTLYAALRLVLFLFSLI